MSTDHVSGEKPSLGQWQEKTKVNYKSKTKATSWVVTHTINLLAKFLLGLSGFFFSLQCHCRGWGMNLLGCT